MNDKIIEVENLIKSYGEIRAADDVSFSVSRGTIVSILGPNGAGKTTTLECAEGLLKPDSGRIRINGEAGIQLQSSALPETLTVSEAMRLFCSYRKVRFREDLLRRFGLDVDSNKQYSQLSTGKKRRLSLALSIIHQPEILFLDEPSAGLDAHSRAELHRIIRELTEQGTAIVLATHDMAEAETLSDRIIILLGGRVIAEGTPREITARGEAYSKLSVKTAGGSLHDYAKQLPFISGLNLNDDYTVLFSEEIGETTVALLNKLKENGDSLIDLRIERPSLEERFIEITGVSS